MRIHPLFLGLLLVLLGCGRGSKILLSQTKLDNAVIFETQKANIYISRADVVQYCDRVLQENKFSRSMKLLRDFATSDASEPALVKDSMALIKMDTTNMSVMQIKRYSVNNFLETDWSKPQNYIIDALRACALELSHQGKVCVWDKFKAEFVPYIYYREQSNSFSSEAELRLPNDTLIMRMLLRIK